MGNPDLVSNDTITVKNIGMGKDINNSVHHIDRTVDTLGSTIKAKQILSRRVPVRVTTEDLDLENKSFY